MTGVTYNNEEFRIHNIGKVVRIATISENISLIKNSKSYTRTFDQVHDP